MAGLVLATPIILICAFKFGVAGTSPATTPVCDTKRLNMLSSHVT
jgi:hypothetical protein